MPLSQFKKSVSYALLAAGLVFAAQAQAVTVDFQVKSSWADGYSSDVIITNDTSKPIDGWILNLAMGHALKSVARANVTATDPYIFTPLSYSAAIPVNGTQRIALTGASAFDASTLKKCVFNAAPCTILVNGKALSAPTATAKPVATATKAPVATNTPVPTAVATAKPTATSTPRPTATSTPLPTATQKPTPTATKKPTATTTPKPTATSTPAPTATQVTVVISTPRPTATKKPVATATKKPTPTATSKPRATATSTPRPIATKAPTSQASYVGEYKVTDIGLHFDGKQVGYTAPDNGTDVYDYKFGGSISAHGDSIKKVGDFIFTTWYKGGKTERNVMLSRYNIKTKVVKTIQFPHRHTGFNNQWWIGESHNTIAVGVSPKDGVIHLLYDMHSYNNDLFKDDYFRYSYTKKNAATVSDADFKLDLFEKDNQGDYTHVALNGTADPAQFSDLTYPYFFLNDDNDLLMHMRVGGNDNGAYVFTKYNSSTGKWDRFTRFNQMDAKRFGEAYNWGLYGRVKYVNGKLRVGFQKRSNNKTDKYTYQNGIYYAYSDDQSGRSQWKDHEGTAFSIPFAKAERIKIFEPGDLVATTAKDQVYIVDGFDYTVTDRGDVHFISKVQDKQNKVTKFVHTYKPAGSAKFINTTDFIGGTQIYTAGNNIYLIALKNGRVVIQKAAGGSNDFTTIYQATTGKSFRHGVPYIENGVLYYYLMENESGTAQPLYVQIIDLGIGG